MKIFIRVLASLLLLAAFASTLRAEEVIQRFVSDLTVQADGTVRVTETITVLAEGREIRRGILRDFPTRYKTPDGKDYIVQFNVHSVRRNGHAEPWSLSSISNGVSVRIGDADVMLAHGPHTYEITYSATGELGYFDGFDEIYWNVTGNGWTLPIEAAEAVIHLPPGATVLQHAAYTGPQGATGKAFEVLAAEDQTYRAQTTARLEPFAGFTVAVGFTKGIVTPPPAPPDTTELSYKVLGGGVGLMFLYYLVTWFFAGRDPKGRPVIPLFHPPTGMGPADVRYVWKQVFDDKSFAAAVIGLAAKKRITITGTDPHVITRGKNSGDPLALSELALYTVTPRNLAITDSNAGEISGMRAALEDNIDTAYGNKTYRRNRMWFWGGIVLSLLLLVPLFMTVRAEEFAMALLLVFVCGTVWALILWLAFIGVSKLRSTRGWSLLVILAIVPLLVAGLVFPAVFIEGAEGSTLWIYLAGVAAFPLMHIVFFKLLSAPTLLGAQLMAEVQGLRLYLATAEEQRLDALNPPEKTPELFERLLPYALALDCENQWSERFAGVLAAAGYVPPIAVSDLADFTRDLNDSRHGSSSAGSATSSSSWSPGSSSGSSGGGSSGGGGGGGGGSGW